MPKKSPWNKGKSVGQKAPFSPSQVQTIKQILENEGNLRDLALFSVGIDTMLRGVDLLALTVSDVTDHQGKVIEQLTIFQQKTGKGTVVALLPAGALAVDKSLWQALLALPFHGRTEEQGKSHYHRPLQTFGQTMGRLRQT